MMKVKKIIVGLIIVPFISIIFWIKVSPPLQSGTIASDRESTSVVVGVGNKGFSDIQITKVYINNGETPTEVKMQINHPDKGFVITDDFSSSEAATYNFVSLTDAKIAKRTLISDMYEKQDQKQVKEDDKIYGLTILNEQPIYKVDIHYRYLGLSYETKISLN